MFKTQNNFLYLKEYATIDVIMAYQTLSSFRIKANRIFDGLNFSLYRKTPCRKPVSQTCQRELHVVCFIFPFEAARCRAYILCMDNYLNDY